MKSLISVVTEIGLVNLSGQKNQTESQEAGRDW